MAICNFSYSQSDYKLKLNAKNNFEISFNNIKNKKIVGKGYASVDIIYSSKVNYFKIKVLNLNRKTMYGDEIIDYKEFQLLYKEISEIFDKYFKGKMIENKTLYRVTLLIHINK